MNYFICVCFSELTDTISSFRIQILSNLTLTLTTKIICLITNTFVDKGYQGLGATAQWENTQAAHTRSSLKSSALKEKEENQIL